MARVAWIVLFLVMFGFGLFLTVMGWGLASEPLVQGSPSVPIGVALVVMGVGSCVVAVNSMYNVLRHGHWNPQRNTNKQARPQEQSRLRTAPDRSAGSEGDRGIGSAGQGGSALGHLARRTC